MNEHKNITGKNWNPQVVFCGYFLMSADHGELAVSRDISNMPLS